MDNVDKKITNLLLIMFGVSLFLWLPIIPIRVVPEVTLKVIDTEGKPMPDNTVIQWWRHWTYDSTLRKDEVISDLDGTVSFKEKSVWVSIGKFLYGSFGENIWTYIDIHAGFGPDNGFTVKNSLSEDKWCYPKSKCGNKKSLKEIIIKERKK